MDFDLDINNYSVSELYEVFQLHSPSIALTKDDIKNAKKMVMKSHPDKSNLNPSVYLFFRKAFGKLQFIYEYQQKTANQSTNQSTKYKPADYDFTEQKALVDSFFEKNPHIQQSGAQFNEWFNNLFDTYFLEKESGYEDWLASNDDEYVPTSAVKNRSDIMREMDKYEASKRHLILCKSEPESIDIFGSKQMFTDLKQAYTEPLYCVDDPKYHQPVQSVNEYKNRRSTAAGSYMDNNAAHVQEQMRIKQEREMAEIAQQSFQNSIHYDSIKNKYNQFNSHLQTIQNKR